MRHRLALLLALLALVLGLPGFAPADDGGNGGDTSAVAINTKDGSSLFKFAFAIKKELGDVVDNQNVAFAYASCEECRTTAISIQIVLVVGSPSTVTPGNFAFSINENCTLCRTFSSAYQFVLGVPDASAGLTKDGKRELKEILREFKALKEQQYTLEEFKATTDSLAQRLREVLRTQLVSRGGDEELEGDVDEQETQPAPPMSSGGEVETDATFTATVPATQ